MANQKVSARTAATSLTGAEIVAIIQSGVDKKTTTQDIANLSVPAFTKFVFWLSKSGATITGTSKENAFTGITFSFAAGATGYIDITASASAFTANTNIINTVIYNGTDAYAVVGVYTSATVFSLAFVKCSDGTLAVPSTFIQTLIELRKY